MGSDFSFSDEICQGGLSMPNPNAIDVPNLGFSEEQSAVLHIMMNRSDKDYSTVDEIAHTDELSEYSYDMLCDAVSELNRRGFLLEVTKPYGCVYAVNKLRISNMQFVYGA